MDLLLPALINGGKMEFYMVDSVPVRCPFLMGVLGWYTSTIAVPTPPPLISPPSLGV